MSERRGWNEPSAAYPLSRYLKRALTRRDSGVPTAIDQPLTASSAAAERDNTSLLESANLFTKAQPARDLHLSTRSIDRLHVKRQGPPRVRIGGHILYRRAGVLAWLDKQEEHTGLEGNPGEGKSLPEPIPPGYAPFS
ncbi:MAG: hypothetical protein ACP5M4_13105 [Acidobacteriaceae bacterium]